MIVEILISGGTCRVVAPYNSAFVAHARCLGGRWERPAWVFDARDEGRVRDLCMQHYGCDGRTQDLVTIRVEWKRAEEAFCGPLALAGRTIAVASGRDSGARLGEGVVLLTGRFGSGGSVKNWRTTVVAGTVVLLRDFPRGVAESLLEDDSEPWAVSIEAERPCHDVAALRQERERILARLAEIDAVLGEAASV